MLKAPSTPQGEPAGAQAVAIPRLPPRDEALLDEIYVESMQVVWALIYWLFILGGSVMTLFAVPYLIWADKGDMPVSGRAIFLGVGLLDLLLGWGLRRRSQRVRNERRRATLEGLACPARLKHVRSAIGLKIFFMQPDFLHTFDIQMPGGRVVEYRVKLPLDASGHLDDRDDLFALVHEPSQSILIPETLGRRARLVD